MSAYIYLEYKINLSLHQAKTICEKLGFNQTHLEGSRGYEDLLCDFFNRNTSSKINMEYNNIFILFHTVSYKTSFESTEKLMVVENDLPSIEMIRKYFLETGVTNIEDLKTSITVELQLN